MYVYTDSSWYLPPFLHNYLAGLHLLEKHNSLLLPPISPPLNLLKALCGVGAISICEGDGGREKSGCKANRAEENSGGIPLFTMKSFLELTNRAEATPGRSIIFIENGAKPFSSGFKENPDSQARLGFSDLQTGLQAIPRTLVRMRHFQD